MESLLPGAGIPSLVFPLYLRQCTLPDLAKKNARQKAQMIHQYMHNLACIKIMQSMISSTAPMIDQVIIWRHPKSLPDQVLNFRRLSLLTLMHAFTQMVVSK